MNYYQIVAFAQHLKNENMKNNNDAFIDDAYNEESKLYNDFMDEVKRHDYSYMMSDSHSVYMAGRSVERQIEEKLHILVSVCRYDANDLLDRVLSEVKQQYNDRDSNGDDLTHRVIKGWFKNYTEDLGPEYDGAGFTEDDRKLFTLNNDR
jgi:C-terminal processing protease CtpA/Prc